VTDETRSLLRRASAALSLVASQAEFEPGSRLDHVALTTIGIVRVTWTDAAGHRHADEIAL
jgi:hypothetical protein